MLTDTQVTVLGQSAGAVSIATLYLNSGLENLVRGTVRTAFAFGDTLLM